MLELLPKAVTGTSKALQVNAPGAGILFSTGTPTITTGICAVLFTAFWRFFALPVLPTMGTAWKRRVRGWTDVSEAEERKFRKDHGP